MSNLLLSKIGHVISEFPLAFKQTKEVKLFMTLLVKNEERDAGRESTVP